MATAMGAILNIEKGPVGIPTEDGVMVLKLLDSAQGEWRRALKE